MRVADDVTRMAGNAIARTVESELNAIRDGWKADRAELTRLREAIRGLRCDNQGFLGMTNIPCNCQICKIKADALNPPEQSCSSTTANDSASLSA